MGGLPNIWGHPTCRNELTQKTWDCDPYKACSQGWPLAAICKFQFRGCSLIPYFLFSKKNGSLCQTVCVKQYAFCWPLAFLGESEVLIHAKQKVPMWPDTNEGPGTVWWASLVERAFHMGCHKLLLGELSVSCIGDSNRKRLLEACSWFPSNFAPWAFCLCWPCF